MPARLSAASGDQHGRDHEQRPERARVFNSTVRGIVFPPLPAFYNKPASIDELVDDTVERVLTLLGAPGARPQSWAGLGNAT